MTLVLHLGAHKTGTTLIQGFARDSKFLKDRGVSSIGRKLWGEGRNCRPVPETKQSEILSHISSCYDEGTRHVLMSNEVLLGEPFDATRPGLYPDARYLAEKLALWLPSENISIVYYLRDYSSFIESFYVQRVQQGGKTPFDRWIKRVDLDSLSWGVVVGALRAAFPSANLSVRVFEDEMRLGANEFLRSFFSIVDGRFEGDVLENFQFKGRANQGLGDVGLELALRTNRVEMSKAKRWKLRLFLQAEFSNGEYPRPVLLSGEQSRSLSSRYASDVAELSASSSLASSS